MGILRGEILQAESLTTELCPFRFGIHHVIRALGSRDKRDLIPADWLLEATTSRSGDGVCIIH